MRYIPLLLCAAGFLAIVFGYWGVATVDGRRRFDEMAGMSPLAVGVLGAAFLIAGAVWLLIRWRS